MPFQCQNVNSSSMHSLKYDNRTPLPRNCLKFAVWNADRSPLLMLPENSPDSGSIQKWLHRQLNPCNKEDQWLPRWPSQSHPSPFRLYIYIWYDPPSSYMRHSHLCFNIPQISRINPLIVHRAFRVVRRLDINKKK